MPWWDRACSRGRDRDRTRVRDHRHRSSMPVEFTRQGARGARRALAERLTQPRDRWSASYVSRRTVESHVSSLLRKLDAANRRVLAGRARDLLHERKRRGPTPPRSLALPAQARAPRRSCDLRRAPVRAGVGCKTRGPVRRRCHVADRCVAGEAGIGKSRLVAEFAAEVHADGWPGPPWRRVSRTASARTSPSCTRSASRHRRCRPPRSVAVPGQAQHPSCKWCRNWHERSILPHVQARRLSSNPDRAQILEALAVYFSRGPRDIAPVLLIIEDIHWSTATTRGAIRHLARHGGARADARSWPPSEMPGPISTSRRSCFWLTSVDCPPWRRSICEGSPSHRSRSWSPTSTASSDPDAIYEQTGGNPLFATELEETAGVSEVRSSGSSPAATRTSTLTDLGLLDVVSVIGTEFDVDLLSAAADPPTDRHSWRHWSEPRPPLSSSRSPGRPGRFAFVHAPFRRRPLQRTHIDTTAPASPGRRRRARTPRR